MAGVGDLGQRVVGGDPSPHARAMAADLDRLGIQVRPENILQVRNILLGEAQRLHDAMAKYGPDLVIGDCGRDLVSPLATVGFNEKMKNLAGLCQDYIRALRDAGNALDDAARSYGHTEAEIKGSFSAYWQARLPELTAQLEQRESARDVPPLLRVLAESDCTAPDLPGMFGARP